MDDDDDYDNSDDDDDDDYDDDEQEYDDGDPDLKMCKDTYGTPHLGYPNLIKKHPHGHYARRLTKYY